MWGSKEHVETPNYIPANRCFCCVDCGGYCDSASACTYCGSRVLFSVDKALSRVDRQDELMMLMTNGQLARA